MSVRFAIDIIDFMNITIISSGDELILGQTIETNAAWISEQVAPLGLTNIEHITVGDDAQRLAYYLRERSQHATLIFVTGGLGPTDDDITRFVVGDVLGVPLALNEQALADIEKVFAKSNKGMPEKNRIQAMIPQGATVVDNLCGTAPGMKCEINKATCYFMPGVPREMKMMFDRFIVEEIKMDHADALVGQHYVTRSLHLTGIGESTLASLLGDLMVRGKNPLVNCTVKAGIITLRINAHCADLTAGRAMISPIEKKIRALLGEKIFSTDGMSLAEAVAEKLLSRQQTVAVAESCTGGKLGAALTAVSGASDFFSGGVLTYSNEMKVRLLGVDRKLIGRVGAVSEEVALAMACNVRRTACSDYGIGITGIAGPTGGTSEKPVGLVYIGISDHGGEAVYKHCFSGDREHVRDRAVIVALDMLRKRMLS